MGLRGAMHETTRSAATASLDQGARDGVQRFDRLVSDHKDRIYTYVRRLTNQSPDADDLTQEVFIRAYKSMAAFRGDAKVGTWLYRIATNVVIDRHRMTQRRVQSISIDDEKSAVGELRAEGREASPAGRLEARELQDQVQQAVGSLPDKLRQAVVLHDLEGLSYEETAEALGCPVGTVKSRLFNAKTLLKKKLRSYLER